MRNPTLITCNGEGVSQDLEEAARWYRKAAEQGFADAQYCLGRMYRDGKGVSEDLKKEALWIRKAEEQGCVDAQDALAGMYGTGTGVP
jgi:TPR repeat protein